MDSLFDFLHFFAMLTALPIPRVTMALFTGDRPGFTHSEERYDHWVLLGTSRGKFSFAFDADAPAVCEPGEFLLCRPGVRLRRAALETIRFHFIRFHWKNDLAPAWHGRHRITDLARLESTLDSLEKAAAHQGAGAASLWMNHLLSDLLNLRLYERSEVAGRTGPGEDRVMRQMAGKLRQDLQNPASLKELAASLRLTPSQFSRRFLAATGINPSAYRTRMRMQESRRLLLETTLSIEAISEACGFENAFYFSRVFAQQTGQAPSHFRKSRRV